MTKDLISIRKHLHQHPELANHEYKTSQYIRDILNDLDNPPKVRVVAETGVLATYGSGLQGNHLLFRCELDALPIQEVNDFNHKSTIDGVSHKCGHDGHMAIILGLAKQLSDSPINRGTITLLFQPAEETGEGAGNVLKDGALEELKPTLSFALHNVPGLPIGAVVIKDGPFNAAVKSMVIKYRGKTSHAAEPENGLNPALAIAETLLFAKSIEQPDTSQDDFKLVVPVHSNLGEKANGVSAGMGEVHLTMRCWKNDQMAQIVNLLEVEVRRLSKEYELGCEIGFEEPFEASINHSHASNLIRASASKSNQQIIEKTEAFKWGEDFGRITAKYPGAMFGLGSGENCPALHNPDYDFPDQLISVGIAMFYGIIVECGLTN